MILEQYIGELMVAIISTSTTWFITRHKQRADTKKIEVEVLEKALQVLNADVVLPLRVELKKVQGENVTISYELKKLRNAIAKLYNCRWLDACPIRVELRRQEDSDRKGQKRQQPTNRQREPGDIHEDEAGSDPGGDSGDPG